MFAFLSCEDPIAHPDDIDLPTRGKIKMYVDENVTPLSELLIDAFEGTYQDAFLFQHYGSEPEVIQSLLDDTARLAIMTRTLTKDEMKYFEAKKFGVEQIKIASDAVVFLVNRNNPDSIFTTEQIKQMLLGNDTMWTDINGDSKLGALHVVFDNGRSSNLRYLSDTLLGGKAPGRNCYALSSSDSVIAYVNRTPGAVGIVGLNWLGDKYSDADVARRSQISVAMIGAERSKAVHPTQSNLVTHLYPFVRGIYIVKIGLRAGLGTGFATFCYQERGQLIVQHAGLAPSNPAERKVLINTH
jgi:phosphate transport system substrate-binding protein